MQRPLSLQHFMSKKKTVGAILFSLSLILLAGCQAQNEYVSVKHYKKLAGQVNPKQEATDEQIDNQITSLVESDYTKEKVKRESRDGDIVNIDYVGKIKGKKFDGGSAKKVNIEIGLGNYLPANGEYKSFEDQLIGHKANEKFDIKVKFPDEYGNKELNGKVATFTITMHSVNKKIVPEANDDWVQKYTNKQYKTLDEYKAELKKKMQKSLDDAYDNEIKTALYTELLKQTEVKKDLPKKEVEKQANTLISNYKDTAKQYGLEYKDFVSQQTGMEVKDFEKAMKKEAENTIKWKYTAKAIAKAENIKVSKKKYTEYATYLIQQTGLESASKIKEVYGEDFINDYALEEEVLKFCQKTVDVVESQSQNNLTINQ